MPIVKRVSSPPPLGPIDGTVPKKVAFPHLVGCETLLERKLQTLPNGSYLLPASETRLWHATKTTNDRVSIVEYASFPDASALINVGVGDEELRNMIASRLEQNSLRQIAPSCKLPANLSQWSIVTMPVCGVMIRQQPDRCVFFSLAARHPTYFDLAVTMPDSTCVTLAYNHVSERGWAHSYDKNIVFTQPAMAPGERVGAGALFGEPNFLLHTVWRSGDLVREQAVVWVSGYQQTPLARFAQNRPTVFLLDHDTETLYYVPVRLDAASVGNNTSCAVVCVRPVPGSQMLQCMLIEGVYAGGDVNRVSVQMMQTVAHMRF